MPAAAASAPRRNGCACASSAASTNAAGSASLVPALVAKIVNGNVTQA